MRFRERLFPHWIWRLPADRQQVALTFDDGPCPQSTPRLLKALDELQIPATMFVLGERCAADPALAQECASAGHSIAIHGYSHQSFLWRSSGWQRDSIMRTVNALSQAGIDYERLFRPPYGRFNAATPRILTRLGFRGVLWSQIAKDWIEQRPARLDQALLRNLHAGGVILLHDRPLTVGNVIHSLPRLAEEVARRGWQFTSLTHPLYSQPVSL